MKNKLVIIGCGGHARSVADVYLSNIPDAELLFIDEEAKKNETIFNFPILREYNFSNEKFFFGIGNNEKRALKIQYYTHCNNLETIVSKNSYLGKNSFLEKGVFVAHNAHIGPESRIGYNSIVNTSASLDHEVMIGNNCHIAPNSTICGRVQISNNVFIGAGVVIIDKVKICEQVTIGAGSLVLKDITEPGVYVGNPIRKIK